MSWQPIPSLMITQVGVKNNAKVGHQGSQCAVGLGILQPFDDSDHVLYHNPPNQPPPFRNANENQYLLRIL